MESFRIVSDSGREYSISVEEARPPFQALVRTLIDIDLQTFSEPTFSYYTAAVLMRFGQVYLLRADDAVIGTCVCTRCWERPSDVLILSMGIRPGWRGRGLGQRFLYGVMDRVRARGLRAMQLVVSKDNRRARKVYEDVGFVETSEAVLDPRTGEAFVGMTVVLQEPSVTPLPAPVVE